MAPELDLLRKENHDLANDNELIRGNIYNLEEDFGRSIQEYKDKNLYLERERDKLEEINEQLFSKLKLMQQKFEDRGLIQEKEKR